MILHKYKKIKAENLTKKKIKDIPVKVFKPEDFNEYVKQMKKFDIEVEVIANTKLKSLKDDQLEENEEYLVIKDYNFEITKPKDKRAKFFIPISDTKFIRVEKSSLLLIILLLFLLGSIIFGTIMIPKPPVVEEKPIEMEEGDDWDGEMPRTEDSQEAQESTVIPGFAEIKATTSANLVPLMNPDENTVNFVYLILEETGSKVYNTVSSNEEAYKFITANNIEYQNYQDEKGNYLLQDPATGKTYNEIKEYSSNITDKGIEIIEKTYQVIYFSKGIAPGKKIDWNVANSLGIGEHTCEFRISTYDVETNAQCYGAVQTVKISIN